MEQPAIAGPAAAPPDASGPDPLTGDSAAPQGPLLRIAYLLGGIGLLGATLADSLAVLGRHTGWHLLGSIELVQAAVIVLGASAMLIATVVRGHASVHILTERLSEPTAARMARLASFVSGLVFLVLAGGSIEVAADLWSGFEQTELLHIPLRWLRLLWIVFALLIAWRFLRDAVKPSLAQRSAS